MSEIDRVAMLEGNLSRQLGWIAAADSKASFVFAVDTAMLGVLAAVSPKSGSAWNVVPAIFAFVAAVLSLAALLFLCFALFPRTAGPSVSVIYFGAIAERGATRFKEAIASLSEDDYLTDLVTQCHRNAEIASRKFCWVQSALVSLYLSVLPWAIAIFLLYKA